MRAFTTAAIAIVTALSIYGAVNIIRIDRAIAGIAASAEVQLAAMVQNEVRPVMEAIAR